MDYFIVNFDLFRRMYFEYIDFIKFVDILFNRKKVEVLDKSEVIDKVIFMCFCIMIEELWDMILVDDINFMFVFGYLIGYFVVYWFDLDSFKSVGNLQDVQYMEVVGVRVDGQIDVVYLFSYFDSFFGVLENYVNIWF